MNEREKRFVENEIRAQILIVLIVTLELELLVFLGLWRPALSVATLGLIFSLRRLSLLLLFRRVLRYHIRQILSIFGEMTLLLPDSLFVSGGHFCRVEIQ